MPHFRFGSFRFDPQNAILLCADETIPLRPQLLDLLDVFLKQKGTVLSKDDLLDLVWDGAAVTDDAIFRTIGDLRRVLASRSPDDVFIKTIPKKGYCWVYSDVSEESHSIGQVSGVSESGPLSRPEEFTELSELRIEPAVTRKHNSRTRFLFWLIPALTVILAVAWGIWSAKNKNRPAASLREAGDSTQGQQPSNYRLAFLPVHNETGNPDLKWVELGLADTLVDFMTEDPTLQVISTREMLQTIDRKAVLQEPGPPDSKIVDQLMAGVNCNLVVGVGLTEGEDTYNLSYWVYAPQGLTVKGVALGESPIIAARKMVLELSHRWSDVGLSHLVRFPENAFVHESYAAGRDLFLKGNSEDARHYFEVCLNEDAGFLPAALWLGVCLDDVGEIDKSRDMLQTTVDRARLEGQTVLEIGANQQLARHFLNRGQYESGIKHLQEALNLVASEADQTPLSSLTSDLALAQFEWATNIMDYPRLDLAEQLAQKALTIAIEANHQIFVSKAYVILGHVLDAQDHPEAALSHYEKALQIERRLDDAFGAAIVMSNIAVIHRQLDQLDEAEKSYRYVLEVMESAGHERNAAIILNNLGNVVADRREYARAIEFLEDSLRRAELVQDEATQAMAHLNLARVQGYVGNVDASKGHLKHAEAWYEGGLRVAMCHAVIAYQQSDFDEAARIAQEAKENHESWSNDYEPLLEAFLASKSRNRKVPLP